MAVPVPSKPLSMIVFDKDGTLGDCTQSLHVWIGRMADCIVAELIHNNIRDQAKIEKILYLFYSTVGWDSENKKLMDSSECILSSGTWQQVMEVTSNCLDIFIPNASQKVSYWHENLGDIHAKDKPLVPNLESLLQSLKDQGYIIAVCTSDDRNATTHCMKNWNIAHLVDYSICGDEVKEAKPSSSPLLQLCSMAKVSEEQCIVVGDTSADVGMGLNGNAGLIIGVLTGSSTADYLLDEGADLVIPNIGYLPRILGAPKVRRDSDLTINTTGSDISDYSISYNIDN